MGHESSLSKGRVQPILCKSKTNNYLGICKLLHSPCTLEATRHKVHGNKQAHMELVAKLPCASCISIANATIYREHHYVKAIFTHFADTFVDTKVSFLIENTSCYSSFL